MRPFPLSTPLCLLIFAGLCLLSVSAQNSSTASASPSAAASSTASSSAAPPLPVLPQYVLNTTLINLECGFDDSISSVAGFQTWTEYVMVGDWINGLTIALDNYLDFSEPCTIGDPSSSVFDFIVGAPVSEDELAGYVTESFLIIQLGFNLTQSPTVAAFVYDNAPPLPVLPPYVLNMTFIESDCYFDEEVNSVVGFQAVVDDATLVDWVGQLVGGLAYYLEVDEPCILADPSSPVVDFIVGAPVSEDELAGYVTESFLIIQLGFNLTQSPTVAAFVYVPDVGPVGGSSSSSSSALPPASSASSTTGTASTTASTAVRPPTSSSSASSFASSSSTGSGTVFFSDYFGLSDGAKLALGLIVGLFVPLALIAFCCWTCRRTKSASNYSSSASPRKHARMEEDDNRSHTLNLDDPPVEYSVSRGDHGGGGGKNYGDEGMEEVKLDMDQYNNGEQETKPKKKKKKGTKKNGKIKKKRMSDDESEVDELEMGGI